MSLYNINNIAIIVDIGNTFVSIGFFKDREFYDSFDIRSNIDAIKNAKESLIKFKEAKKIENRDVIGGLICSVVPSISKIVQDLIFEIFNVKLNFMTYEHFKYLKMDIDNPKEVGGDIAADIAMAYEHYPHPCLVMDLGTISKNIYLDDNGVFVGTSFFPGVEACLKAMNEKTALLPEVDLAKKQKNILGKNTIEAMMSGVYFGTSLGIKAIASEIEKLSDKPLTKILTGGNSKVLSKELPEFIFDPHHVLKGIYLIYKNN